MTRRGRPRGALGPEALATLSLASVRPVTFFDVHREVGLSRAHAIDTVRRGRRDGWLVDAGTTRLPGVPRPVVRVTAAQYTVEQRLSLLDSLPHLLSRSS